MMEGETRREASVWVGLFNGCQRVLIAATEEVHRYRIEWVSSRWRSDACDGSY